MKELAQNRWSHSLLLLVWIAIGASVRFTHLTAKPPWTDEFATLVFSLGHSFTTVPLDQVISLETLLYPLQPTENVTSGSVVNYLLTEDVHPPLYFVLAHWWMQLFSPEQGLVSLWAARSLPALLGTLSVPTVFGVSWLAFRSTSVAHLAAAMMAVSPFGVYLAQEARHYTLAILWVSGCLGCLAIAVQSIHRRTPLPFWVVLLWISTNTLGLATHHFFLLTLIATAAVLVASAVSEWRHDRRALLRSHWYRIYAVVLGTSAVSIIWVPLWQGIRSHEITQWIQSGNQFSILNLINPIFQSLAAWITMLVLLPVESAQISIVILAGLAMIIFLVRAVPLLWRGLRWQQLHVLPGLAVQTFCGFVLTAIVLFFVITYGFGTDLTRGARYNFVYFPAVIILLGAGLAALWQAGLSVQKTTAIHHLPTASTTPVAGAIEGDAALGLMTANSPARFWQGIVNLSGKQIVILVLLVGFLSSLTVVNNLGYQKYYRPDVLVPVIKARSQFPVLIATTHNTLVQVGELMGVGWQVRAEQTVATSNSSSSTPDFLLAHQEQQDCLDNCPVSQTLKTALAQLPMPIDLWLVNFNAPVELEAQSCIADTQQQPYASGYRYQHYRCVASSNANPIGAAQVYFQPHS